jgi:alpha-glucosidase
MFYDFETGEATRGRAAFFHVKDVPFDRIPLHVRGGCVIPLRVDSANTTTELRKKSFELLVAPGLDDGVAQGTLYVDDGVSLDGGENRLRLEFRYADGQLHTSVMDGDRGATGYDLVDRMEVAGIKIERVKVLGGSKCPMEETGYSAYDQA